MIAMSRILLFVVLVAAAGAAGVGHKHHPKFRKLSAESQHDGHFIRKACSSDHENERSRLIDQARCGTPKELFVALESQAAHEQVSPGAAWVKRCAGLCDHIHGTKCIPLETRIKYIPVRVFNVKSNRESCHTYELEEHVTCGCCSGDADSCLSPKEYDPRKCACRCPNRKEKRFCRSKRNQIMRWNPSKCTCEEKLRVG